MFSIVLITGLMTATPSAAPDVATCTADRLRPFVHATGLRQPWPVVPDDAQLSVDTSGGVLIADAGRTLDGYSHWLVVDAAARTSYVIERGGFAGRQKIYGPLPVAVCPAS